MSLQVSGQVQKGVFPNVASGSSAQPLTQGQFGEALVSELNGRYGNLVLAGQVFSASNSAAAAFSVQGTAAATGFILSNPAGSGKNVVLLDLEFQYTVATAAAAQAILYAGPSPLSTAVVHTTPLTVQNCLIGGAASSVAKADSAATIVVAAPAIVPVRVIQASATTGPAAVVLPYVKDEIAGAVIVTPGCFVAIQGTAAIAGAVASMTWAELPL